MIGESGGMTTLINNERIHRGNQGSSERRIPVQDEELSKQKNPDVTSFSSEGLALAKKLVPVGGSPEQGQIEQQDQGQNKSLNSTARFLDIRV